MEWRLSECKSKYINKEINSPNVCDFIKEISDTAVLGNVTLFLPSYIQNLINASRQTFSYIWCSLKLSQTVILVSHDSIDIQELSETKPSNGG